MSAKIKIEDLPEEVLARIGYGKAEPGEMPVPDKLVVMGKVLRLMAGLTSNEAVWLLTRVLKDIRGQKERRGGKHGSPGRPPKETIDE